MWYFPYGIDIEKESVNNARLEHFKDNIIESLAREVCQNSLDAKAGDKPVVLEFAYKDIDVKNNIKSQQFIDTIIPKSKATWVNDEPAQAFLSSYEKQLKKHKLPVLKISDYNTTGLIGSKWESLIENAGTSDKDSTSSAGSFGIGKAAPFAASDLRMVFYSTQYKGYKQKSIGVVKFVSFNINKEEGKIAQGVGYLGRDKKKPYLMTENFDFDPREEDGTDIYIMGFNQASNWKKHIIESMLSNFLLSIYNGDLEVVVGEDHISRKNLNKHIMDLDDSKYNRVTKNYYQTLVSETRKKFLLDDRFKKFGFEPDDGYLLISTSPEANRSVLMTRKAGMKIFDRKNISGSIQFNGIFQATGSKINQILREMENPNHDDWVASRYNKNPKKAKELNLELFRFFKDKVTETFKEEIDEKVDAFGLSNFLPNKLNPDDLKMKTKVPSIEKKKIKVKPKEIKKRNRKNVGHNIDGEVYYDDLVKTGVIEGDEYSRKKTHSEGEKNTTGNGSIDTGNALSVDSDSSEIFNIKKSREITNSLEIKVQERDYQRGDYMMIIDPKRDFNNIVFELFVTGESGYNYRMKVVSAQCKKSALDLQNNKFFIPELKKNVLAVVMLKIDFSERVQLAVKAYEN